MDHGLKALKIILYALLATPILLSSVFLFPFITSKILYFRVLVELALVFYVPLALKYPELRPRKNPLSLMVWGYMAVMAITSIIGLNFGKSLMGTVERGEGIVTMLHFAVYFTILPAVLRTKKEWMRYLSAAAAVIVFTAVIGLVQLACVDPTGAGQGICGMVPPTQGERISATIGNAAFFAAFLIFGVFLSWYLGTESERKLDKWLFYLAAVFNAYILIQTQTRGGAIALYAGVLILILHYVFRGGKKRLRAAMAATAILMIAAPAVIFIKPEILPGPAREIPIVRRLSTISRTDVTTQSRLDTWQASWRGWKDRFITGYGYENYNLAFNKYFPPSIFKDQGSQVWFDRAHNIIFDVAVTSGIVGLIAYLGIFAAALAVLYRLYRRSQAVGRGILILAVMLMAYFGQNFFVFDTQATYLLFFIVLAYIAHLSSADSGGRVVPPGPNSGAKVYDLGYLPAAGMAVAMLITAYFVNWEPGRANYFTTLGIKSARSQAYRELLPQFKNALSYGTYMDEEIRQRLVDYANEAAASGQLSPQEVSSLRLYVVSELEKSIAESPHDVKNYLYLMSVLNRTGETSTMDQVFGLGKKALELSSTRPQIYFELGQAAFLANRIDEGLEYFRSGVELNTQPKESHFNYLLAAILAKRPDLAAQEMAEIERRGHEFTVNDYISLARAYFQAGDKQQAAEQYKLALMLDPDSLDLHVRLAAIYGDLCDIPAARAHVLEAIRLDSRFQADGEKFFQELESKCPAK